MLIIQNAVKIVEPPNPPVYMLSPDRHSFRSYTFKNSEMYFIDGGKDYLRRGGEIPQAELASQQAFVEDFSLCADFPFDTIKKKLLWGTCGKLNDEKLHYIPLIECTTEHLRAILDFKFRVGSLKGTIHEKVIRALLAERT
jgi:hypothetical protein